MDTMKRILRKSERHSVRIIASCRTDRGVVGDVVAADLSLQGCRIETSGMPLRMHQRVILRIKGLEPLPATVCWVKGLRAGLQFERALHIAVLSYLCGVNPPDFAQEQAAEKRGKPGVAIDQDLRSRRPRRQWTD